MPTLAQFLRSTSPPALHSYFSTLPHPLPADLPWDGSTPDLVPPLLGAVDALQLEARDQVMTDAQRIGALADEAGEAALYAVGTPDQCTRLDACENRHDRATYLFVNDPVAFGHAEEVRFADDKRQGAMWDAYKLQPGCDVTRDPGACRVFEAAIAAAFDSRHVQVELCDRARARLEGDDVRLMQVTVYREGRSNDVREFVGGRLDRRLYRPVIEAALTYEPDTGNTEVVASAKETREQLVRMFAAHLLGHLFEGERLPMRHYSLEPLRQAFAFPTDPQDGIEGVRVTLLGLMPYDSPGERVTLECRRGCVRTIWELAEERLRDQGQRIDDYQITKAQFAIAFRGGPGRRGRSLPVRIAMPQGCNLKDRTGPERLIGERYLKRWGFLQEG